MQGHRANPQHGSDHPGSTHTLTVPAVALSAHRALHPEGHELFLEVAAGVLAASI
jgi:hypothetical protein